MRIYMHLCVCVCVCVCVCIYVYIYIYIYVQSDSGGICITLGNDSMSDLSKKVHTNMGPILNGYGVMGIF